jgi:hypothetical protein
MITWSNSLRTAVRLTKWLQRSITPRSVFPFFWSPVKADEQSLLISQRQPELMARFAPKRTPSTSSKRPSDTKPLVDLSAPGQVRETGFTGKGLLSMI